MFCLTLLALLCCSITINAEAIQPSSSYSGEYGGAGGKPFSQYGNQLEGPITAIRIWVKQLHIGGLQVRYGKEWSKYEGVSSGVPEEISLSPGESITQVSGRYSRYINQLIFVTDKGHVFSIGRDVGTRFNAVPLNSGTVLRYISGRSGTSINAIGFHWDNYPSNCTSCGK